MEWDPVQYARYADERSRAFHELTSRIAASSPREVVDVGCGSGELTTTLARRWEHARVRGVDSSGEMIGQARGGGRVSFCVQRAEDLDASGVNVLVSNAALQWVPTHRELLTRWARELSVDGWLAFQVPANFQEPSHRLMRELAASEQWSARLSGVLRETPVAEPSEYLELLTLRGLRTEVWQTQYLHVLQGEDPVLEWVRGTGLRPVRAVLGAEEGAVFERAYAALLTEAYPPRPYGTVLPFRRTFVVGHKEA